VDKKSNITSKGKKAFFDKIVDLLRKSRCEVVRSVNKAMVYTYYEIGRVIVEDEQKGEHRAEYGKKVLGELSKRLTQEFGKGFSVENLDRMRYFYKIYSQQISSTLLTKSQECKSSMRLLDVASYEFKLSWSHYLKLMRIDDLQARKFYEIEAFENNWSLRELDRQYDSALYERLGLSKDKKKVKELSERGQIIETPQDVIKDPYILEFIGLTENAKYSESNLEQKLINKLEHFLLELGKGFVFVGRQERFTFDEQHFRVDLVFYNRILKCFVLIDLKIGKLKHQDIGQMQMYVNYYDRKIRLKDENKTIGIVLCQQKNDAIIQYTLPKDNKQIFASKYQTVLPSKEDFKKLISDQK
jgi:predicted nuclease of restriction endonuclease-like (RecB) superfamily